MPVDPYTSTREQFTNDLTSRPVPANASSDWKAFVEVYQSLVAKLANHEAMAANLQQTYKTPANEKNKVYFMWDFVGRTLGMLYIIPPNTSSARMGDVLSRPNMAASLMLDEMPGMLDQMVGPSSANVSFGEYILADARRLKNI